MIFKTTKGGGFLTHSLSSNKAKPTEADMAYEILKAQGNPMYYQGLIEEVLRRLGIPQEAIRIAAALTQINLDTRFSFLGRGEWGLKVWDPMKVPRRSQPVTLMTKSSSSDDKSDAEELDDLDSIDEDISDIDEDESDEGLRREKW
ncbi:MAG TPA: DNA-directed RNA polymerase subunit delta [Desulfosporosinus sp.]